MDQWWIMIRPNCHQPHPSLYVLCISSSPAARFFATTPCIPTTFRANFSLTHWNISQVYISIKIIIYVFKKLKCHLKNLLREELANNRQMVIVMVHLGTPTHGQVELQNWPENLTATMQVSIDTAVLHCEVMKVHILALMIELNRHSRHWWQHWYVCYFCSLFPQAASARKVGFEHNSPGWVHELALTQCSEAETMTWHSTSSQNVAAELP